MVEIKEIQQDGVVLARHIPSELAWEEGLNFFSNDGEYVQVGTWGYDTGRQLLPHVHNTFPREVLWTQEVLYVKHGSLRAGIFNREEKKIAEVIAKAGDILILLNGGHGYQILEEQTKVLEIKNGPYLGAQKDRRRI